MKYRHVAEPVKDERIPHDTLMSWDKDARVILGLVFDDKDKDREPPSMEEFAEITRGLVWEVQRLKQLIAIRAEEDRIAEQIEKGYR